MELGKADEENIGDVDYQHDILTNDIDEVLQSLELLEIFLTEIL